MFQFQRHQESRDHVVGANGHHRVDDLLVKSRLQQEGAGRLRLGSAAFAQELGRELALWRAVASNPSMQLR